MCSLCSFSQLKNIKHNSFALKTYELHSSIIILSFVQLGFNLINRVTDTLESSSILIYLIHVKGIYTQEITLIKTGN